MQVLLSLLAVGLIRLLRLTWRVTLVGEPPDLTGPPLIFCFWHGDQAGLFAHPRTRPAAVLASRSRDGALQAKILIRLGFRVRRGSSSRGGAAGLIGLIEEMKAGADVLFAVDGPRGPRHEIKPGAIHLAQTMNTHLVPLSAKASSAWVFHKAWDRYTLPKPFAKVVIRRGPAISPVGSYEYVAANLRQALLDHSDSSSGTRSRGLA